MTISYNIHLSKEHDKTRLKIIDGLRKYNSPTLGYLGINTYITVSAHNGDKLVGGLVAYYAAYLCKVGWLWIDESYRRKGIARQLIQTLEEHISSQGCKLIHLDTFSLNARELFLSQGFEQIATIDNYINDNSCYFFSKKLPPPSYPNTSTHA